MIYLRLRKSGNRRWRERPTHERKENQKHKSHSITEWLLF